MLEKIMSTASNEQLLIDELSDLKKQVSTLQQDVTKVGVMVNNNDASIRGIDDRLRKAETTIKLVTAEDKHIREEFDSKIKAQTEIIKTIGKPIESIQETVKEIQGEINQIRIEISMMKERYDADAKNRESYKSILHPVFSWIIIVLVSLLAGAVFYTLSVQNEPTQKPKHRIERTPK